MTYESAKRLYSQIKHEKDPYVWKSKPPEFTKAKHDIQKIDKLISDLPSFYKLDIWDKYISHDIEMTRLAAQYFMEESKMNNNVNKNLNDDLNNIRWVVESWEVEDSPFAGVYRPRDFKVTFSGRFNDKAPKQIDFYRFTNTLADKLNSKASNTTPPTIKNVIFNDPATIVFWTDNTKTVVKCQEDEAFDPEKGITMAYFKKMHGNKGAYFNEIKKWTDKYTENSPSKSASVYYSSFTEGFAKDISDVIDNFQKLRDAIDEVTKLNEEGPRD